MYYIALHFQTASRKLKEIPRPANGKVHSRTGPRKKKNQREADHSLPSSADVNKARSYASTPYVFKVRYLFKHKDTFTLFFFIISTVFKVAATLHVYISASRGSTAECRYGKGYEEHQNITEGGCFEIQPPGSLSETGVPCPCGCWCQVACQAQWYYSVLKYNPLTAEYHHEET